MTTAGHMFRQDFPNAANGFDTELWGREACAEDTANPPNLWVTRARFLGTGILSP